ncbi:MAG: hypothetical protein CV089_06325 [Nitrospira sp. WS110]|nr:hypothetical protein [Nitrospira sp. WS110]
MTLTGTVQSWAEKHVAADVVKSVRGVQSVHNDLVVNAKAERTDKEIKADVEARLRSDVFLTDDTILVRTSSGIWNCWAMWGVPLKRLVRPDWLM